MAFTASVIMNIAHSMYGKKGETKNFTPLDFMPEWDVEKRKETKQKPAKTVDEFKQILMGIAKVQNNKVAKEKRMQNKPPVKRTK